MATEKDIIYVDIDDEITAIIDKVRGSDGKVIALVLPKRATVFQSVVNMKLLKRAADAAKKHLVLVTTEANLMPLAGAVGLHVASTPQSKPEIPVALTPTADDEAVDEPLEDAGYTADNSGDRSVGELAQRSGHVIGEAEAVVDLDDVEDADEDEGPTKVHKNRHLKVPNFNAFRLRLFLAILALIAVIVGFYIANIVLPKAVITISTNTSTVNVSISPTLDTAANKLDTTKLIIPATSQQQQKTVSQQVDATGEKNTGDTASGSVTMAAEACSFPYSAPTIPTGSGLSTSDLTFITQSEPNFHPVPSDKQNCVKYESDSVDIVAQSAGCKYNVGIISSQSANDCNLTAGGSQATFSVVVPSSDNGVTVTGTGSANGGTDDLVKIVSQADIDGARKKLNSQDTSDTQAALVSQLRAAGLYPLTVTFSAGKPKVTTDKNVGDQADTVTVTEAITYTMLGVKQSDLDALIMANVATQIDAKSQVIINDGLDQATITVGAVSGSQTTLGLQTTATVGPDINVADIKRQAAGKQIGDVKAMINQIPGVKSVTVQLSPFWISTVPTNSRQVVVIVDKGR